MLNFIYIQILGDNYNEEYNAEDFGLTPEQFDLVKQIFSSKSNVPEIKFPNMIDMGVDKKKLIYSVMIIIIEMIGIG